MPFDKSKYPDNWQEIRQQILERDNHKCKFCGVENYAIGARDCNGEFVLKSDFWSMRRSERNQRFNISSDNEIYGKEIKIILTIAHLGTDYPDGTPGDKHDKMDVRPENLAALCQQCHLRYDIDEHMENAARTRERKIREAGQLDFLHLFEAVQYDSLD